jgi:hypothetical protein
MDSTFRSTLVFIETENSVRLTTWFSQHGSDYVYTCTTYQTAQHSHSLVDEQQLVAPESDTCSTHFSAMLVMTTINMQQGYIFRYAAV